MKRILLFLTLLTLYATTEAQISYTQNGAQLNFQLSTMSPFAQLLQPGDAVSKTSPRSKFIFETGNGYFYSTVDPSHTYPSALPYKTVLSLSGLYDTIKPPPLFLRTVNPGISSTTPTKHPAPFLLTGEFIRITPIASELNANDEMLYIITYQVPIGADKAKIIFFYNHQNFEVFEPIDNNSTVNNSYVGTSSDPSQISRIRTYFNEAWVGANDATLANKVNSLPNGHGLLSSANKNPLNLSWIWDINENRNYEEHNIFITIPTKHNLPDQAFGYVEAALLYHKSENTIDTVEKGIKKASSLPDYNYREVSSINTSVSLDPHDPNYIRAMPGCIKKEPGTKEVEYKIHFQNEGAGNAFDLHIDAFFDKKLKAALAELDSNSFKIYIANKLLGDVDFGNLTITKNSFSVDIKLGGDGKKMTLHNNKVPFWFCNPLTMGDIYFKLKVPIDNEADFAAYADITFYNRADSGMAPVRTAVDTLHIRDSCNGTIFPRIKPLPENCCKKLGPLCWYWWVAIGLITIIIIWAFARKKKTGKYKNGSVKY